MEARGCFVTLQLTPEMHIMGLGHPHRYTAVWNAPNTSKARTCLVLCYSGGYTELWHVWSWVHFCRRAA